MSATKPTFPSVRAADPRESASRDSSGDCKPLTVLDLATGGHEATSPADRIAAIEISAPEPVPPPDGPPAADPAAPAEREFRWTPRIVRRVAATFRLLRVRRSRRRLADLAHSQVCSSGLIWRATASCSPSYCRGIVCAMLFATRCCMNARCTASGVLTVTLQASDVGCNGI